MEDERYRRMRKKRRSEMKNKQIGVSMKQENKQEGIIEEKDW